LTEERRRHPLVCFIVLSEDYHCGRLSNARHRLLNLPDMLRTNRSWQSVGQNVGPALIGQAEKYTLYLQLDSNCMVLRYCWLS